MRSGGDSVTDIEWFTQLYEQWFKTINRYLKGSSLAQLLCLDASEINDLTQEVLLTLWDKRAKVRVHPNFGGWIIKTADNMLKNYCATKKTRKRFIPSSLDEETPEGLHVVLDKASLAQDKIIRDRESKLEKLREIQQFVGKDAYAMLLDYYSRDNDTARMAEKNGVTPSGLRMRVKRIIDRVKKAGINMMLSFRA